MMKKLLLFLCAGLSISGYAQEPLPYFCDFSNPTQNAAWQQFRTGSLATPVYQWEIGGQNARLSHDYPVGASSNDTTKDWFVSPAFDFSSGAELAFKFNISAFAGHSQPQDEIGVYLLTGSPNPELATISHLADLTGYASTDMSFRDTSGIIILPTSGDVYIAFYYQTTNDWITAGIDSVSISSGATGMKTLLPKEVKMEISPNPAQSTVRVLLTEECHNARLTIMDMSGRVLKNMDVNGQYADMDISDMASGVYQVRLQTGKHLFTKKLTVNH